MEKTVTRENLLVFRDFLQIRTGLFFPESKFFSIEKIMQANFENTPFPSFSEYLLHLRSQEGAFRLRRLISLLTTNETYFFRGLPYFDLLEKQLLPELVQKAASASKSLSIWSAGCSTGEEPYSIAIVLKKILPTFPDWHIEIIATDIDGTALEKAKKGIYSRWSFRGMDELLIAQSFIEEDGNYRIKDDYKKWVSFRENNLISDLPPKPTDPKLKFDLIFCRNVTLYFDHETTRKLANVFFDSLADTAYLIVGHAEHSADHYASFKSRSYPDAIVYQKTHKLQETKALRPVTRKKLIKTNNHLSDLFKKKKRPKAAPTKPVPYARQRSAPNEESRIFREALGAYIDKKEEFAIDRFLRVLDINPKNAMACWMLSHIASNREDFDGALAWAERSIAINPLAKEPYYTLSIIYLAQRAFEKALAAIKKTIYIDHEFALGHFVMGQIYHLQHQPGQAKRCLKTACTLLQCKESEAVNFFEIENLNVADLINAIGVKTRQR